MAQSRSYYVDWRMLRDVKRRKLAYEYADESTPSARTPSCPRSCRKWLIKRLLPCPGTAAL
ncbi:mitochondrial ribosomal protein S14 [Columba livia]|uniref:Mitochondrial ribosomal protein S14 n=1 Tax=Columba livia TaxID=8932 RepID=A0A2I0MBR0_COLLI|nr:mitochondrial ribosomal protein S14 [Columba livia]